MDYQNDNPFFYKSKNKLYFLVKVYVPLTVSKVMS